MAVNYNKALSTWDNLNNVLRDCNEEIAQQLLELELSGKKRPTFVMRIHCRCNRLRANRERKVLRGQK